MSQALFETAMQHIDIAVVFVDLGLVNPAKILSAYLSKLGETGTKKDFLKAFLPFLMRFHSSQDAKKNEYLDELAKEMSTVLPEEQKSNITTYLESHMIGFRRTGSQKAPSFEEVF